MSREKIYKYPNPEKIQINESDLKLKLKEYYERVRKSGKGRILDLFIIIPAWIPVFTSDFNDIFSISGSKIIGAYIAIMFTGTIAWIFSSWSILYRVYKEKIKKDEDWLNKNEIDPYKIVANIKSECK